MSNNYFQPILFILSLRQPGMFKVRHPTNIDEQKKQNRGEWLTLQLPAMREKQLSLVNCIDPTGK